VSDAAGGSVVTATIVRFSLRSVAQPEQSSASTSVQVFVMAETLN
jgi:hypothetical protein